MTAYEVAAWSGATARFGSRCCLGRPGRLNNGKETDTIFFRCLTAVGPITVTIYLTAVRDFVL